MEQDTHVLEINLISAQGLKAPTANLRRMQTYALAWVNPSTKIRSRVDRVGGENPTWNDKFLFRVSSGFLSSETSAVSIEIYAVGYIKDPIVGSVRLLVSSCVSAASGSGIGIPAFTAVQIRRPSGRFHGVLNIAVTLFDGGEFAAFSGMSAVCFRELMGKNRHHQRQLSRGESKKSQQSSGGESCEFSCGESADYSDGADSTTSSSSATSTALKEWNGERTEMAGKKESKSDAGGLLCGLTLQRKIHLCPSDPKFQFLAASMGKKKMDGGDPFV
ncbi:uncharacterized protein LOC132279692 [Cornus florida]|uniref:uncharacterized protein LOC132279692 n=1 Tax=Cornus florida TaxID=4283 RepID=UPI00289CB49F|nr:uncharacterized protein LOC132279692 [Cornus florida]